MQRERTAKGAARGGVQQKGFFRGRLGYHDVYAFALTLYGISEQLCFLQAGTKHAVLALLIIPKSWTQPEKKKKNHNNQIPSSLCSPLNFALFFFSFSTQRHILLGFDGVFLFCFFFESSGLKILGHLGILGASGRSGAEHREVLGRPRRREGCAGACAARRGAAGGKRGHRHF